MALKFENKTILFGITNYDIIENGQQIGTIEAGNTKGIFISSIDVFANFQNQGYGFEAFKKIFNEMNAVETIHTIRASWHESPLFSHVTNGMSTNLTIYLQSLQTKNKIDSAFSTPTGKWVKKLGFRNCQILSHSLDNKHVEVDFTK
jgi:hypothetical protein